MRASGSERRDVLRHNGGMVLRVSLRRAADRWADRFVRRGRRKVLWTQPTANLGNFLYDWMHVWTWQRRGLDIRALRTPATERWIPLFGTAAEDLVVARDRVRWTDRREKDVYSAFGRSFTCKELDDFIAGFIAPSGLIDPDGVPPGRSAGPGDVVVNVRRGDYYASEANRRAYAFDLDEYLAAALAQAAKQSSITRLIVVSDGIDWCIEHLGWMREHASAVEFVTEPLPPETHLAIVANAPRLILANSTFSYWCGYLSTWLSEQPQQVIAPWFHIRPEGAAWQLDPRWMIVKDIPSQWDLPAE